MNLIETLAKESCYANIDAVDCEDVLHILANKLHNDGIVKEDFEKNVIKREREFPTGLPLPGHKVAIPHTDSEYVNKTRICVAVLKNPVEFRIMGGSKDETVMVDVVIMMAIKDKDKQVGTLSELINLVVGNSTLIESLLKSKNDEELYEKIVSCLSYI